MLLDVLVDVPLDVPLLDMPLPLPLPLPLNDAPHRGQANWFALEILGPGADAENPEESA
jgi:hypothetical protein